MLDAEVARLDPSGPTWRLAKIYRVALEVLLATLPAAVIGYVSLSLSPDVRFEYGLAHEIGILLGILLCGFAAYLAWHCHLQTGDPFPRWLTRGLAGFSLLSIPQGIATRFADHQGLLTLYGSTARLVLAAGLLGAVFRYGDASAPPCDSGKGRYWRGSMGTIIVLGALLAALSVLADSRIASRLMEAAIVALSIASLLLSNRRALASSPMTLYGFAVACFAQSAFANMIAEPWSHLWWLAHGIFTLGLLLLGYGVVTAFLSTRSFGKAYRQEDLVEELSRTNRQLQEVLADAQQANAALSRQVMLADESYLQFESVFALAPDATLIMGADGSILKANERARRLFGYSDEAFSGLKVENLIPNQHGADPAQHRPPCRQAPDAPSMSRQYVLPGLRWDGTRFPAEISLGPLQFNGQPCTVAIVRDITETRQAAEQIRQSERQFRDMFERAPIGMSLTGLDGCLMEANESLCKLLGYTRDELVGMRWQDVTHPDDLASNASRFQELVAGSVDAYRLEKRYLHKNGTPVWAFLSISMQRDAEGRPLNLLAQIIDIGGIKAAQQALSESELRLQRVLEGSNDGFWDRHIPSGTTTFSPRWATMLGYDSSEIVSNVTSWEKLVHPDDLPMCRRIIAEHLSGERDRYEAVYRMRHKAGHWLWILARGKAYEWDEDGRPLRMAGTHTDVTVRQLTTEALRLRERTLKAVLEALPIGV